MHGWILTARCTCASSRSLSGACAEVFLNRGLGYGTYAVTVRDASHFEPAVVFSMITFDESGGDQYYRELDVEISRWGDAASKNNAQYGVQPFYIPRNVFQFNVPSGPVTHLMRWESGRASFKSVKGPSVSGTTVIAQHEFTSSIPSPGRERAYLVFYIVPSEKYPIQKGSEVVIDKFEYLP